MTALKLAAAALAFALLATANSGGYRYGVSDQAFYLPAAVRAIAPATFPRDAPLLEVQTRLMLGDDLIAPVSRLTGVSLPWLFALLYATTLAVLFGAAVAFARAQRFSWAATTAFLVLLTFRHRIARTGANSLEGYMHPRMLAFALGIAALAAMVRGRMPWAIAAVAVAAVAHPTTALWFGIVVAAGLATQHTRRDSRVMPILLVAVGLAGVWAVVAGPLAGRLGRMDPAWLAVFQNKDYLFPTDWPVYAWVLNLAYFPLIVALYRLRVRAGAAPPGEHAVVVGLGLLFAIFLISVPLTWWRVAIAVQFQVTRVFWLMDAVLAAYAAWWLADRVAAGRRAVVATVLVVLASSSALRGVYLLTNPQSDRQLVQIDLAPTAWADVLRWLRTQPVTWHVLADPDHGWKHGISVRVGAERDTVIEAGKDTAIAMYDREVAMRVADRLEALAGFETLGLPEMLALEARYSVDVLVVARTQALDLPVLYANTDFVVYDLR